MSQLDFSAVLGTPVLFSDALAASGTGPVSFTGVGLMFASGVAWSVFVIASKPLIERYGAVHFITTTVMISTLPMLSLAGSRTPHTVAACAYVTVCGMICATTCRNFAGFAWAQFTGRDRRLSADNAARPMRAN